MYHVLLPVDSEEGSGEASVEALLGLPGVEETTVTILHVFEEFTAFDDGGGAVSSEAFYDPSDVPDTVAAARERLEEAGVETDVRVEHGEPPAVIQEVAMELGVDHIVMAGRKRTPVGKVLFGSAAQAVILSASVPVTVV